MIFKTCFLAYFLKHSGFHEHWIIGRNKKIQDVELDLDVDV